MQWGESVAAPSELTQLKLRPGPGIPASEVERHQRARLHRAMFQLVAERGYDRVTVRALVSTAKVSSRSFYQHFQGVHDCFEQTQAIATRLAQAPDEHALPKTWIEAMLTSLDPRYVPRSSLAELHPSPSKGTPREREGAPAPAGDDPLHPAGDQMALATSA